VKWPFAAELEGNMIKIHVAPGMDARKAAHDLLKDGAVGIDDIGENLYDVIRDEIIEELGHVADEIDIKTQRVDTSIGPVFVLRDANIWTAAKARKAVLMSWGKLP